MNKALLVMSLVFIASCTDVEEAKDAGVDTAQSVITLPTDSIIQPMPVAPMDTAESNMPVVSPDTGKVVPK